MGVERSLALGNCPGIQRKTTTRNLSNGGEAYVANHRYRKECFGHTSSGEIDFIDSQLEASPFMKNGGEWGGVMVGGAIVGERDGPGMEC